jgi:hypothetical protein
MSHKTALGLCALDRRMGKEHFSEKSVSSPSLTGVRAQAQFSGYVRREGLKS